jgi:putative membrane protein
MRVLIAAFACLSASTALAQAPSGPHFPTAPGLSRSANGQLRKAEQIFVNEAERINLAEIRFGQLALQKGSTPQIRQLAQTMIDDYKLAHGRLQQVAASEGLMLPKQLSPEQQATYQQLLKLKGSDFDDAYLDQLQSDQVMTSSLYEDEAQNGRDPQLRAFAQSTLPSLQRHQQLELATRPAKKM